MPFFGTDSEQYKAYEQVTKAPHKAHLSHELIAGAAAYQAAKAYQEHCEKQGGKPSSHAKAKEIFAGLAGAAVTHLVETKGLDLKDKHEAEKAAREHAEHHIAHQYK